MRVLGVDVGRRRIGLAISDPTATLARPLATLTVTSAREAIDRVVEETERLRSEDDGLDEIVVGLPSRLDGSPSPQTEHARAFIRALRSRTPLAVLSADERLTSREAESRLAERERDWRRRKPKLDAAAAALVLQEYLDRRHSRSR
jgi:putative Holliday junction resolvase